jgi:drug/metabolite transporter (DMT)-like permease
MAADVARPFAVGSGLAVASAVAFGVTTPFVQRFGHGVGPFTTAALLYAGAACVSLAPRDGNEAPVRRADAARLVAVAFLGAVVAPVALAWGLQRTSGVTASLLLNLEAVFTVVLARAVWREPIGWRVAIAAGAMVAGGALLVADGRAASAAGGWGTIAVIVATLGWAADNVFGRPLADRDPTRVVLAKGALGAALSFALARGLSEGSPRWTSAVALLAAGAIGYGASLRLYLRAQRIIGAARAGSVFAVAPFVGAAVAWALGERAGGAATLAAGGLCAIGVWLHGTEAHEHEHTHEPLVHEHAHRHDDGHHHHTHDVLPEGEHSHPHRHDATRHAHPHGPDAHHRHGH